MKLQDGKLWGATADLYWRTEPAWTDKITHNQSNVEKEEEEKKTTVSYYGQHLLKFTFPKWPRPKTLIGRKSSIQQGCPANLKTYATKI